MPAALDPGDKLRQRRRGADAHERETARHGYDRTNRRQAKYHTESPEARPCVSAEQGEEDRPHDGSDQGGQPQAPAGPQQPHHEIQLDPLVQQENRRSLDNCFEEAQGLRRRVHVRAGAPDSVSHPGIRQPPQEQDRQVGQQRPRPP
jgi:hypothetical protein